ncbi:hypothetical protein VCRA2116O29_200067 [Vibrio crassostreae]|nr:hypothetical protein VCRA2116O29_200067 [Vibrio crassostreae]CAK2560315.1 hypothetical protein VCRA2119O48_70067 [Vibrio crassostreae]CAK3686732.1 hypothetical protein VCRA2123O74_200024 [Vibrio crassostreae]CAK4012809.1 hypothetical protein VCRA212O16_60096 [Vibrio crassostreae]
MQVIDSNLLIPQLLYQPFMLAALTAAFFNFVFYSHLKSPFLY